MNGIPLRIVRDGNQEIVHLSTRRSGDIGKAIHKIKADCRKIERELAAALKKIALASIAAARADLPMDELMRLSQEQDAAMEKRDALSAELTVLAERLALLVLTENYGDGEATAIIDLLTDAQIRAIPQILESGDVPADFFPSSARPSSASGSSPTGATTADASSTPAASVPTT